MDSEKLFRPIRGNMRPTERRKELNSYLPIKSFKHGSALRQTETWISEKQAKGFPDKS